VGVRVADQKVEDSRLRSREAIESGGAGVPVQQLRERAIGRQPPPVLLVLEIGREAERLAQILLVHATVRPRLQLAVESLHDEAPAPGGGDELDAGARQAAAGGQAHAEALVCRESRMVAAGQLGLEDVAARHAVQRPAEASAAIADEHRLVLHAGEAEPQTSIAGAHTEGVARQCLDQLVQLAIVEPADRRTLRDPPGVEDLQRAGAVAAQLGEQTVGVARRQLELARDPLAHSSLRQQRLEERTALARAEALLGQRQRERDRA